MNFFYPGIDEAKPSRSADAGDAFSSAGAAVGRAANVGAADSRARTSADSPNPALDLLGSANDLSTLNGFLQAEQSINNKVRPAAPGHGGGLLSGLGLVADGYDISQNGLDVDNGLSLTSNAAGLASYGAGLAGATNASPLMASFATGLTLGNMSNDAVERWGWLGESSDVKPDGTRRNRNWSDLASDMGYEEEQRWGGGVYGKLKGAQKTAEGSLTGTLASIVTAPLYLAEAVYGLGSDAGEFAPSLLEGLDFEALAAAARERQQTGQ